MHAHVYMFALLDVVATLITIVFLSAHATTINLAILLHAFVPLHLLAADISMVCECIDRIHS